MSEEGIKYDCGKLEWSQLVPEFLQGMIRVLMLGAKKYRDFNWQFVEPWDVRYYNSTKRHLEDWWMGKTIDSESNEHALLHAACDLMFLWWCEVIGKKTRTLIGSIPQKPKSKT